MVIAAEHWSIKASFSIGDEERSSKRNSSSSSYLSPKNKNNSSIKMVKAFLMTMSPLSSFPLSANESKMDWPASHPFDRSIDCEGMSKVRFLITVWTRDLEATKTNGTGVNIFNQASKSQTQISFVASSPVRSVATPYFG